MNRTCEPEAGKNSSIWTGEGNIFGNVRDHNELLTCLYANRQKYISKKTHFHQLEVNQKVKKR